MIGRKVICFSGIDGSGKSLHARLVLRELSAGRARCKYKWLRYPRFFSMLPLTVSHLLHLRERGDLSPTSHEPSTNRLMASRTIGTLWMFIVFVDTFLSSVRHIYLPSLSGYTLVVDRFAVDPLIDIVVHSVAPKNESLVFSALGKLFAKLIPRNSLVLVLDIEEGAAAARKKHPADSHSTARSRALYRSLARIHGWNLIRTDRPIAQVHDEIMKLVRGI